MTEAWRLIRSPAAPGRRNMAEDEAILESVTAGESPPTLRLYAWDPPCLSLGRAQPEDVVDLRALSDEGWDLVRRPTGGRALLHADELTYAVIAPADHPAISGGVLESYRDLSRGLLAALQELGLTPDPPEALSLSPEQRANPICFEVPSAYEITVGGLKLIGSAQLRRRGALLQHGSLPLRGDITRVIRALRYDDPVARREAADRLGRHATTLEAELGRSVPWEEAAQAATLGFASALGLRFEEAPLTASELARAAVLERVRRESERVAPAAPGPAP